MDDQGVEPLAEQTTDAPPQQDNAPGKDAESPTLPPLVPEVPPASEHHEKRKHRCKPDQTPAWKIILEVGAFSLGLVFAWIYHGQWEEMKKGTLATQQAVCVASRTLDETTRSNKAQETANVLAAKTAADNLRLDQRAWIEMEPVVPEALPTADSIKGVYRYHIRLRNTGKTFAHEIVVRAQNNGFSTYFGRDEIAKVQDHNLFVVTKPWGPSGYFFGGKRITFKHFFGGSVQSSAPSALSPGAATSAPLTLLGQVPAPYPNPDYPNETGPRITYLVGRVDYMDAFGVRHWLKFCYVITNSEGDVEYCRYGNDVDHNLQ